jgi:hypothetical protein
MTCVTNVSHAYLDTDKLPRREVGTVEAGVEPHDVAHVRDLVAHCQLGAAILKVPLVVVQHLVPFAARGGQLHALGFDTQPARTMDWDRFGSGVSGLLRGPVT